MRLLIVMAVCAMLWATGCRPETPYTNPPADLQDADLAGTWREYYSYGSGDDTLMLRADGTFKQIYRDRSVKGYVFETPWNRWRLERFGDGRVRLHLPGARWYLAGVEFGELDGMDIFDRRDPYLFHDPIANSIIRMPGELVLNVQRSSLGETVLIHMTESSDGGWISLLRGGRAVRFRRVGPPE